jgi:hypothetical protein
MYLCWSVKGGSGTTVVAASLALVLSHRRPALLVDLAGDAPAALGMAEPAGPGVADWLASPTADVAALHRLAVPATDTLHLLPCGSEVPGAGGRWGQLAGALAATDAAVVVDAGTGTPDAAMAAAATHRLLVIRPCYLGLRRRRRRTSTGWCSSPAGNCRGRDVRPGRPWWPRCSTTAWPALSMRTCLRLPPRRPAVATGDEAADCLRPGSPSISWRNSRRSVGSSGGWPTKPSAR